MKTSEQRYIDAFMFNSVDDLHFLSLEYLLNRDLSGAMALSHLCISLNHDKSTIFMAKPLILLSKILSASQFKRSTFVRPLALVIWKCRPIPWKLLVRETSEKNLEKRILNYSFILIILIKIVLIESLGFFPRRVRFQSIKKRLIGLF
jgi:hypothetical protein